MEGAICCYILVHCLMQIPANKQHSKVHRTHCKYQVEETISIWDVFLCAYLVLFSELCTVNSFVNICRKQVSSIFYWAKKTVMRNVQCNTLSQCLSSSLPPPCHNNCQHCNSEALKNDIKVSHLLLVLKKEK